MDYSLLGPIEVRIDGRTVSVGRGKQRALLAVLALNAGRVVPAERLIDELWGDEPPATATTALQVYISRLRKTLGEGAIETRDPGLPRRGRRRRAAFRRARLLGAAQ